MDRIPELRDGEQKVFFRAGGEWCYLWTHATFKKGVPVSVVMHHHGARGYIREGAADWLDDPSKRAYLDAVMGGARCAIAGSHACGDHWGNDRAVAANLALFSALVDNPSIDSKRVGMMGGGLGGALIWNSVAGPMAGKIKVVAVLQAVSSLESIVREQKFKKPLLEAFGLPEDTGDDDAIKHVRPHDPLPKLQRLRSGAHLPRTAIYHGAQDDNIPPNTHAVPLEEALRRAGGDVTLELFPGVGHAVYAIGTPIANRLHAFFGSSL